MSDVVESDWNHVREIWRRWNLRNVRKGERTEYIRACIQIPYVFMYCTLCDSPRMTLN